MRVLVVDDAADTRKLLKDLLTAEGYQVTVAAGAVEALVHLKITDFNVMLLDLMMPGVAGEDLARMVAARWETSEMPVIVLSCRKDAEAKAWAQLQGCFRYLEKPFRPAELIEVLREISPTGGNYPRRGSPKSTDSKGPPWHRLCSPPTDAAAQDGRLRDLSPPSPLQPP